MISIITEIAHLVGVSPLLLLSVCWQESNHKNVINPTDNGSASYGICQLKVSTAKMIVPSIKASELFDPVINSFIAAKYLKKQLKRYNNDERMAIAAYNAGKVKLNSTGLIVNRKYVKLVIKHKVNKPWRINGKTGR